MKIKLSTVLDLTEKKINYIDLHKRKKECNKLKIIAKIYITFFSPTLGLLHSFFVYE
jgi:hypothetical protein